MKKIFAITFLMLSFVGVVYAYNPNEFDFEKINRDICKLQKDMDYKSASKIRNCEIHGVNLDEKNTFIIRGMENGQCYYQKAEMENVVHGRTVGDCYAPLSVMQSLADAYQQSAQSPCPALGAENEYEQIIKERIRALEAYCSPVKEPFSF